MHVDVSCGSGRFSFRGGEGGGRGVKQTLKILGISLGRTKCCRDFVGRNVKCKSFTQF